MKQHETIEFSFETLDWCQVIWGFVLATANQELIGLRKFRDVNPTQECGDQHSERDDLEGNWRHQEGLHAWRQREQVRPPGSFFFINRYRKQWTVSTLTLKNTMSTACFHVFKTNSVDPPLCLQLFFCRLRTLRYDEKSGKFQRTKEWVLDTDGVLLPCYFDSCNGDIRLWLGFLAS